MSSMSDGQTRFSLVTWLLVAGVFVGLGAMLVRVTQLQVRPSDDLSAHIDTRTSARAELPVRGDLLDRRGRLLSTTRFGERLVLDPVVFPTQVEETVLTLAAAAGVDPADIGVPLIRALEYNAKVAAGENPTEPAASDEAASDGVTPEAVSAVPRVRGPRRYVPVTGVLAPERIAAVRSLKIPGVLIEKQQVREYPGGDDVASIVGKVGVEHQGLMGAELLLNKPLTGEKGKITFVRDAYGRPLWINPGAVQPATPGDDVRLSIDVELQRMAREELQKGIEEADAVGGRLVMLDPASGEILAMVDIIRELPGLAEYPWADVPPPRKRGEPAVKAAPVVLKPGQRYVTLRADPGRLVHPALARNRCVEDIYEPGSTFKPFVWSVITELHLARPEEVFDTEGGRWRTFYGRYIEDVTKRSSMTWTEVLVNSSNIGMIKAAERMKPVQLHEVLTRFGFGKPTHVGLPGEASGIITSLKNWSKYSHTSVAYGHEVSVTPVQMVRAFAAFCRNGEMAGTMPTLRLQASDSSDAGGVTYRVLPAEIALLTRSAMRGVTHNVEGRWIKPPEGGWRYELFGKSGTAEIPLGAAPKGKMRPRGADGYYSDQYNSSFIAGGPVEQPRLVCLVVIDDPGPARIRARSHYGSAVAGPVVRRVMERALTYLGVPAAPEPTTVPAGAAAAPPTASRVPQG